jgi:hypothetical protein
VTGRENGSACWAQGGAGKLLGRALERGEVGRARGGKRRTGRASWAEGEERSRTDWARS